MARTRKNNAKLKEQARLKAKKSASKNPSMEEAATKLSKNQNESTKNQSLPTDSQLNPARNESLQKIIFIELVIAKIYNDFVKSAEEYIKANPKSALAKLNSNLQELGMRSIKEFLDEIELLRLLTTKYSPKGRIFEVLVLKSKRMQLSLISLAEDSWRIMIEIKSKITNIKGKIFDVERFQKIDFEIATDFKTHPDNKLFHDFGLVKYDPQTKELFLISGEIKEPDAGKGIVEQLAKRENRIAPSEAYKSKQISFIWKGKREIIDSENVFLLRDDAVGIARLKEKSRVKKASDINFDSKILDLIDYTPKFTKETNPELIPVFKVKTKDITPDELDKELMQLIKAFNKNQK